MKLFVFAIIFAAAVSLYGQESGYYPASSAAGSQEQPEEPADKESKAPLFIRPLRVISREEIENKGARHAAEALRGETSVAINDQGVLGGLTTLSFRNAKSSQVLILINGQPYPADSSGSVNLSLIAADNIERIEILPNAAALYGSQAAGGAINIVTRKQESRKRFILSFENGSFIPAPSASGSQLDGDYKGRNTNWRSLADSQKAAIGFNFSLAHLTAHGGGSFWRAGNEYNYLETVLRPNGAGGINSEALTRLKTGAGFLGADGYLNLQNSFKAGSLSLNSFGGWHEAGLAGSKSYPTAGDRQTDSFSNSLLQWNSPAFITPQLNLNAAAYFNVRRMDMHRPSAAAYGGQIHTRYGYYNAGASLKQTWQAAATAHIFYGAEYIYDALRSDSPMGNPQRHRAGAYAGSIWQAAPPLSVEPAVRYDWSSDFGSAASGSLGAAWQLGPSHRLYVSGGYAYRAPTFADLYYDDGIFSRSNPNLKPETGWISEVSYSFSGSAVTYQAALFSRFMQNLLVYTTDPNTFAGQTVNAENAWVAGIEQQISIQLPQGFFMKSFYTFSPSFNLDGYRMADVKRLAYAPLHTAALAAGYTSRSWHIELAARANGTRYADNDGTLLLDAYAVFDLRARKFFSAGFVLFGAVENLLNTQYEVLAGYSMPSTALRLGVEASF